MKKKVFRSTAALAGVTVIAASALLIVPGETQSAGSFIALQGVSPGTAQAGNFNINGRGRMANFTMTTGAVAGEFLTTDASGNASWVSLPADGLEFPFTGSYSGAADMFLLNYSGSGGDGIVVDVTNAANAAEGVEVLHAGTGDGVFSQMTGNGRAGLFQITSASSSNALEGRTNGTVAAIFGDNTHASSGYGVRGNSINNIGVFGDATGTSGQNYGVYGRTASVSGWAVFGIATAATGGSVGGVFQTNSSSGFGAYGEALSDTGTTYGVYGRVFSPTGRAVTGYSASTSGLNYGGVFSSDSSAGRGVYGAGDVYGVEGYSFGNGTGVYGQTSYINGNAIKGFAAASGTAQNYGVAGESAGNSGRGVLGYTTANSSTTYGVIGDVVHASASAVHAVGRLTASGVKAFRIDHPADPANKYLFHYCAEAPEPINIYSGSVRLDGAGNAIVDLPDYYGSINKEARIQLTPAGAAMPELFASEEVVGNQFQISGGKPNGKVYWEVKAVRNDKWTQEYGAPIEVEKEGSERGTYQHPELYGQPYSKKFLKQLDTKSTRSGDLRGTSVSPKGR